MLVLSRRKKQTIKIGDSILITIVNIKNDQVKIGFTAPKEFTILRDNTKLKERKN